MRLGSAARRASPLRDTIDKLDMILNEIPQMERKVPSPVHYFCSVNWLRTGKSSVALHHFIFADFPLNYRECIAQIQAMYDPLIKASKKAAINATQKSMAVNQQVVLNKMETILSRVCVQSYHPLARHI